MDYIKQICAPIEQEFEEFRNRYSQLFSSANPGVDLLLKFLLERKGKLMRPILVLLVAKCYGIVKDSTYHLASAVELLHQGSLIHDDVVDETEQMMEDDRTHRRDVANSENYDLDSAGDYDVVRVNSYQQAHRYEGLNEWCITL